MVPRSGSGVLRIPDVLEQLKLSFGELAYFAVSESGADGGLVAQTAACPRDEHRDRDRWIALGVNSPGAQRDGGRLDVADAFGIGFQFRAYGLAMVGQRHERGVQHR